MKNPVAKSDSGDEYQVIDDMTIHCRRHVSGKAPTLLLPNAWPMSLRCWDTVWDGLGQRFNLLAYDMPGFGHSDGKPHHMRPSEQGRFVLKMLDHFGLERVHGVGADVGGPVMLWLAAEHRNRLDSIVVFGGPGYYPQHLAWQINALIHSPGLRALVSHFGNWMAAEAMHRGYARHRPSPEALQDYRSFNCDPGKFRMTLDYLASYPEELPRVEKCLSAIRCPVLLLWGRKDRILSVRSAAQLAQRITNCQLRVLEDCGHYLQEDAGPAFVEQLLEWCGDRHKTLSANSAVPKDTARFFAIL